LNNVLVQSYLSPHDHAYIVPTGQTVTGIFFAIGGAPGQVQVRTVVGGSLIAAFSPLQGYTGPVNVAVGDVTGDGFADLVVANGVGVPEVKVYDGRTLALNPANPEASLLAQWLPYENYAIGANVAVGDIEGNGFADIVTGPATGNPQVNVYRGRDIAMHTFNPQFGRSLINAWFAYGVNFNVGANVAVGDVNGDGYADIVTGATYGNLQVNVYNGQDIARGTFDPSYHHSWLHAWFAYGLNFNVGVTVAVGDTTGDGYGDIITGASRGNPEVKVYDGRAMAQGTFDDNHAEASRLDDFFAYELGANLGVAVGTADFEGTGQVDILTGSINRGNPLLRILHANGSAIRDIALPRWQGGISVGG
jgi:hypothetical protein